MPGWLIRRYQERFGKEDAEAIMTALQKPAATTLVFASTGAASQASTILMNEGYLLRPDPFLPLTCSVERGNPSASAAFSRGLFYIMDPASQAPAALLPLDNVERVLDLCAAPGGKTILLANRLTSKGWVLATDLNPRRLGHVAENVGRLGLNNVRLAQVNVEAGLPFKADWPAVILDAPCSSMGTLRRNPEIRWQVTPEAFRIHAERQLVFLHQASRAVAPGGILAYSVCSIEPEETRDVLNRFLESHQDFRPLSIKPPKVWKGLLAMDGPGSAYLLPHRHPWDAFYVAFFKRAK
jgi:16S rRNA (cytosine967-C5)-methyltransferase